MLTRFNRKTVAVLSGVTASLLAAAPASAGQDKPVVVKKAEDSKPEPKKPEPKKPEGKKAEPAPAPKPEPKAAAKAEGGLKGFFKGLTGSKK